MNHGWELIGPVSAWLHYQWGNVAATRAWSGHLDVNKATLQVAGLNQPLQLNRARLDWNDGLRSASVTDVEGFGATWSGQLAQTGGFGADGGSKWGFPPPGKIPVAGPLCRLVGHRANPCCSQRLPPSLLRRSP